jgi:hypothetical protein
MLCGDGITGQMLRKELAVRRDLRAGLGAHMWPCAVKSNPDGD